MSFASRSTIRMTSTAMRSVSGFTHDNFLRLRIVSRHVGGFRTFKVVLLDCTNRYLRHAGTVAVAAIKQSYVAS